MAKVQVCNVSVFNNPSYFCSRFKFEITFECIEELRDDLEWKMIYIGSAESEDHDQVLDNVLVGPISEGKHMFAFEADGPDSSKIPPSDAIGVTAVLLTCSFKDQEFVRIGYLIYNEYNDPQLKETPPATPKFDKIMRTILDTEPRVTRFKIYWDGAENEAVEKSPPGQSTSTIFFSDNSCSQTSLECENALNNDGARSSTASVK